MPHPFAAQQSLFRAYDIRGAEHYFNAKFVHALGAAFVRLFKAQNGNKLNAKTSATTKTPTVIIGYDVRHGSADIAKLLATVLQQQGLQVISLGLITTPMMAFWSEQYDGHGIMVTASHSAKGILGIKWLVNNASPSAKSIQRLYQDLASTPLSAANNSALINTPSLNSDVAVINLPTSAVAAPYIQAIEEVFTAIYPKHNLSAINNRRVIKKLELTVVIDCLNGATSRIAEPLFSQFCQRVIILNDSPDGSFPTGNPDPTEPNRLAELQQTVIVHSADIGLAFDGDGDRLMIVDNSGKVVTADHLLYLLAKVAITEHPNSLGHSSSLDNCSLDSCNLDNLSSLASLDNENESKVLAKSDDPNGLSSPPQVLFDIKCSHHLPLLLRELGALPVLSKTGSSMMRRQLRAQESSAIFAGELSGHFIFNDGYFTVYDDAMYAGLRLLNWLAYTATSSLNSDARASAVNLWGEQVSASTPYQLTDITKHLPLLVSTADHYIPLADNGSESCNVITHLTEFCYYLQDLITEDQPNTLQASTTSLSSSSLPAMQKLKSCCDCLDIRRYMTSEQAQSLLPTGTRLSSIDGVRLDFTHGFGVLRQSNTSNALTVRFAGDSLDDLKDVQARFVALCRAFDQRLAGEIAAIRAE